jgi:hypothetical protein
LDDYTLYERAWASRNGWRSLQLVRAGRRRRRQKGNWWLGWSIREARLSRNHDAALLRQQRPEVYGWIVGVMQGQEKARSNPTGFLCSEMKITPPASA